MMEIDHTPIKQEESSSYDCLFVNPKSRNTTSNTTSRGSSNSYIYNSSSFVAPYTTEEDPKTRFIDDNKLNTSNYDGKGVSSSSSSLSSKQSLKRINDSSQRGEVFHGQDIDPSLFYRNISTVCQIGSHFHLDCGTVIQSCFYWLAEYSNRSVPVHHYLKSIIQGIYQQAPVVELAGHFGLKYESDLAASYCLLLRFIGPLSHSIPSAYFTKNENLGVLNAFSYIVNPDNQCFISFSSSGMKSEVQVDYFHYDLIMQNFYEPSYYIMTLLVLVLDYLDNRLIKTIFSELNQVKKKVYSYVESEVQSKSHQIINSVLELLLSIEETELVCFRHGDLDKMNRFMQDILNITTIIQESIHDFKQMNEKMFDLWVVKTKYCMEQKASRSRNVLNTMCNENI